MVFEVGSSNSKGKKIDESTNKLNGGMKISVLIVDDDPIIRRIHEVLLSQFGFETCVVEDGKQAVDLFHFGACFDLILMDMEMPIMDGPRATSELRAMGVNSMIIGVTSRGVDSGKQTFMRAGLNNFYTKPLKADAVISILQMMKEEES